jgi:heat shock protein HslJ
MIMDVYLNMLTKLKSFILTAVLFTLVYSAQAQSDSAQAPAPKKVVIIPKLIGRWYLIPALDSDTASGHLPEIVFDVKGAKFTGSTGCNRMAGTYTATDSTIQFSDKMITTRMFCSGYNESAFLQNLLRVDNYKFRNSMLVFMIGDVEVSRWTHKNPKQKKMVKVQPL